MNDNAVELKERLAQKTGPGYWRTMAEFDGVDSVDALVHKEFPNEANQLLDPVSRRNFFKVMGASMMLAGLTSCARQPSELLVPYVKPPEELVSGKPQYYATAMTQAGFAMGLVATSYEGRPTKLEGLKEHPASRGATNSIAQASILDLYDPNRLDTVSYAGNISTWKKLVADMQAGINEVDAEGGDGLRILTGTVTSPTLGWQLSQIVGEYEVASGRYNKGAAKYPKAQWHQYEPEGRDNVRAGAKQAFGGYADTVYNFADAKVVLSLDSNFLMEGAGAVAYARDFAASRDADNNGGHMSRLYVAESTPSLTGANADHKINVRYSDVETIARTVADRLGIAGAKPAADAGSKWLDGVVEDLQAAGGASIVIAGEQQPAVVHALAHAINENLGSAGTTVTHIEPVEVTPANQMDSIKKLTEDINAGKVKTLVIVGGNPAYNTPADLGFAEAMLKVGRVIHLADSMNETSIRSHWVVPQAHYLEAWSDARDFTGTVSIVQPLIKPLYGAKSATELIAVLLGEENPDGYEILTRYWKFQLGGSSFNKVWKTTLAKGMMGDPKRLKKVNVKCKSNFGTHKVAETGNGFDVLFRLDPSVVDGQYANNGWLQELPKPLIKLCWDNAIIMNPQTAKDNHFNHEDVVELSCNGKTVKGAVMFQFGHPKNAITVHLGYGREEVGPVGEGRGFNGYALQSSDSPWFATGNLKPTKKKYMLARTEEHWNIEQSIFDQGERAEERHLIREADLSFYKDNKDFAQKMGHPSPERDMTLYKPDEKAYRNGEGYSWGMTIDLNKCTGCNVCTIACQSENNIPIVGKEDVNKGREMHWIRIDRYYRVEDASVSDNPHVVHQPIPCMQCENAPCEPVCPVGATMHSAEGLNDMTYNRCVGTRYCANNCPYKVRRFNFFHYQIREGQDAPTLKMMRNPNVTVRSRGVMEKCTYCVQRINIARIEAKVRDQQRGGTPLGIQDGDLVTACQAACPSSAIVFGDINNANSQVSKEKTSGRNYALIGDIGTRPRTTYLAKLRNQNATVGVIAEPAVNAHHGAAHGAAHGADADTAHGAEGGHEEAPHHEEETKH